MNEIKSLSKLTFDNCKLGRKKYAKHITDFLLDKNNRLNTLCVNSQWGTGKTWFVHMWINMLKTDYSDKIISVYYNAWENDDFDNAFVPLLAEIDGQLFEKYSGFNFDNLKKAAGEVAKTAVFNGIKTATGGIVDLKPAIEKLDKKTPYESFVSIYNSQKEERSNFIDELSKFATERKEPKKIFIFIDELDRCRPTFAIETLERIKHFFEVENIYFILMLDKQQLSHSVKVLYGNESDTSGYLTRFIDIEYNLPIPSLSIYINSKFGDSRPNQEFFLEIAETMKVSLREFDKLDIWINAFNSQIENSRYKESFSRELRCIAAYFAIVKLKYPEVYSSFFDVNSNSSFEYIMLPYCTEVDELFFKEFKFNLLKYFYTVYIKKNMGLSSLRNYQENKIWIDSTSKNPILKKIDSILSFVIPFNFINDY